MIAIENVRLFNEVQARTRDLSEALTYQTGSANILKVIASSPTDVGPVLNAIVESACELCDSNDAAVLLKDGETYASEHITARSTSTWRNGRSTDDGPPDVAFLDGEPVHLRDAWSEEGKEFPDSKALSNATNSADIRTVLSVPLMRDDDRVGAIVLRRTEVRPFSDKQINLLKMFADQAVIAIGNVRLFEEVQARTRDLTESLEQQTATADVLEGHQHLARRAGTSVPENARECHARLRREFRHDAIGMKTTFSIAAAYNDSARVRGASGRQADHVHHPQSAFGHSP